MKVLKQIWDFLFSFKGRICRTYYAMFLPVMLVIQLVITGFFLAIEFSIKNLRKNGYIPRHILPDLLPLDLNLTTQILIILLVVILYLWIKYAYVTKRAHDFNKSLLESKLIIIPLVLDIWLITDLFFFKHMPIVLLLICSTICLLSLAFIKSTEGDNNFGSPQIPFWKRTKIDN
ncbi:DUF805 domain-containing protein [Haemophilus haemoglobinophilus]|nr:DUF805 domain-containing protein [Canicola haemoglobinophilus]MBN6711942.1 DUF805 domain-containing protein [Canicola haemoglobinophilus]